MEALLYDRLDDNEVRCRLCCHRCVIADGRRGICRVRENRGGVLHSLVYGRLVARHVDPIEKKPLYHFLPGSLSYSIATVGCNLRCRFCQNADIAQMPADRGGAILGETATPAQVVEAAGRAGCRSISYTYTEPTVFFEFALETARLARDRGPAQRLRDQRLHDPRGHRAARARSGRGQRGPQGLHPEVLQGDLRGRPGATCRRPCVACGPPGSSSR